MNCNRVSYYTVAMTTYADGTVVETGTTTDQNYTLTKNYSKCPVREVYEYLLLFLSSYAVAGVPYNSTVWALFGTVAGGKTSQTIFTQELGMWYMAVVFKNVDYFLCATLKLL